VISLFMYGTQCYIHTGNLVPIVRRSSMEESHMNLTKFMYGNKSLEGDITMPFSSTLRYITSSDSDG
jgi:hypothetical protein